MIRPRCAPPINVFTRYSLVPVRTYVCVRAHGNERTRFPAVALLVEWMAERESEELLAEWQSDLEAVLYAPEVEEAIQEVRPLKSVRGCAFSLDCAVLFWDNFYGY